GAYMLSQRGHQLAPPEPVHSNERAAVQTVPHRMIPPELGPTAMMHRDPRTTAALFEAHFDLGALSVGEIARSPLEGKTCRRLPGGDYAHHNNLRAMTI